MVRHVLVPLDGSELAEAALSAAAATAAAFGARVTLFHVLEEWAPQTVHGQRHLTDAAQAEAYLASVAQQSVFDLYGWGAGQLPDWFTDRFPAESASLVDT